MAEYPTLANLLAGPATREEYIERYGIDPQAPFLDRTGQALGQFARQAPLALMGLRAPSAQASMKPFNPKAPDAPLPKRPDGEDVAQHIYDAVLGRTRKAGEQVAQPGSGWWNVLGQPIPKPSNPLPWLGAGGVGYGIYRGLGGPEIVEDFKNDTADWSGLFKDIVTGRVAQKFRDYDAAEKAGVPYPPDPNKP